MKKLLIAFVLSAALLSFSSPAEATTEQVVTGKYKSPTVMYKKPVPARRTTARKSLFTVVPASIDLRSYSTPAHSTSALRVANSWVGSTEHRSSRQLKSFMGVDPRRTPWCAGFVGAVLKRAGKPTTGSLTAASYLRYGRRTVAPRPGDIVVLRNSRGNHVGFYAGTVNVNGRKMVKVLGGNQSNSVKYTVYPAGRVVQYRAY